MGKNGEGSSRGDTECCMCGDHGLSSELFACRNCKFRSQHKYCSNLYPGAESYHICNWCLSQTEDKARQGKTQTSTPPNSSQKPTKSSDLDESMKKMDIKKRVLLVDSINGDHRRTTAASSGQIKKQINREPESGRAGLSGRKRVVSSDGGGRIIRRTRSDVTSNGGNGMIIKHVFRNKVRRYKLLDEVST